ncbi:hypothetical protein R1sor_002063 [Riccia sorocarpa]|uniref:TAFII28-like protein domain-containing protein n=1 Tax=Riccia sorocarpa TaxID=122646 RepID=A0ABD3H1X4_9MARC
MKRSASSAGLADGGENSKSAKLNAGDGTGVSSPPLSPASADASPAASEEHQKDKPEQLKSTGKSGKNAPKKASAQKQILTSPVGSDDDGEGRGRGGRGEEKEIKDDDEDEEENMENVDLGKHHAVDPQRMQAVLNKFTTEQMSRYECYRRSGFQRANMRRILGFVAGSPISIPMTIVMSGISKMFVGELVEVGRIVMNERGDVGPIRPCHIREAYRRLKLEGKVPQRGRAPLFR